MELVPFEAIAKLTESGSKQDLKGVYRRPSASGVSLVHDLPLRRHNDWIGKGLEFVSLATMTDLKEAAGHIRAAGLDPLVMRGSYDRSGNFDFAAYLAEAKLHDAAFIADLQAKVDKFGADAVVEMMRMQNPAFVLPASIVAPTEPAKAKAGK
jgi:hypothetical protein